MNTKLTLRMDESLIAAAKDYAAAQGSSLSQMVANYFAALGQMATDRKQLAPLTATSPSAGPGMSPQTLLPITRSLAGCLKAGPDQATVSEDDYHAYLENKYLTSDDRARTGPAS